MDRLILTRENNTDIGQIIDRTFFTRLKNFAEYVGKNYGAGDFLIDQEWEYIRYVASECLKFQKFTSTPDDNDYFNNLKDD